MAESRQLLYWVWADIKQRCFNPKDHAYKWYGARGITMDNKWLKFDGFSEDMANTYKRGLTLDRINTNGNYCKENCRWATWEEQQNNRRSNKYITVNGVTKSLSQWVKALGLKGSTVRQRLYVYHWPIERCFELEGRI